MQLNLMQCETSLQTIEGQVRIVKLWMDLNTQCLSAWHKVFSYMDLSQMLLPAGDLHCLPLLRDDFLIFKCIKKFIIQDNLASR